MRAPTVLRKPLLLLGIDRAIGYTIIGRIWYILAGPVTIFFIASFLSPVEQGFYYTFGNILALNVFFELGLSFVLLQFASHEKAKLEWTASGTLEGDPLVKGRLASLLRMSLKWYGVVAVLALVTLLPAGFVFFRSAQANGGEVGWQMPWLWLVFTSAGILFTSPIFAILEGCGKVAEVALLRTAQAVLGNLLVWLALLQGARLFAVPLFNSISLLIAVAWLLTSKRALLLDLWRFHQSEVRVSWRQEIWPFQWKIALSWLSGYFIFQLFNPILFAYHGPVAAGQMGMSLSITSAISTLAIAWIQTKSAPFGSLVARKAWRELDELWSRSLWLSFAVAVLGGITFWVAALGLYIMEHPWSVRLLPPLPLGLLVATTVANHIIFAEAVYLRAHKEEPFLWMSLFGGLLMACSTYVLGRAFGALGMVGGYFTLTLTIGLTLNTWIFIRKRRQWHTEESHVAR